MKSKIVKGGLFLFIIASLFSCGIESYSYLPPVISVSSTMNSQAVIHLPDAPDVIAIDFTTGKPPNMTISNQTKDLGSDYEIFYRIYLSDKMEMTVNTDTTRKNVNSTLDSDWTALEPYTIDSNNLSSSVFTAFTNRKYYSLQTASNGNLLRSNGNGAFNPLPESRLFVADDDLVNRANITENINADVQDNSSMSDGTQRYVYVSMYIAMRGFDQLTLNPFYSSPAFVNVFLLPASVPSVGVTGVTLTPPQAAANPAVKLTAAVLPANATNSGVEWSVDIPANARIRVLENNTAIISSISGSGTVRVTVRTNDGGYTASSEVTLSGVAVESISISDTSGIQRESWALSVGQDMHLNAVITPNTASSSVTWISSNPAVASVSNGHVIARALGTAVITAEATDGTELSATCGITVQ
ncbi:MAG: Ig-like domain-containing protein [Spirochaetaceae bacterium]|nr:Ig-like domain-containing protein [Spirochaetaceae bacterium]